MSDLTDYTNRGLESISEYLSHALTRAEHLRFEEGRNDDAWLVLYGAVQKTVDLINDALAVGRS